MTLDLSRPFTGLSYGTVRQNAPIVDALSTPGLPMDQRITDAIAFLRLAFPDATEADFDALSPGAIQVAAAGLYKATYTAQN